jgi:hypothetical protein
MGGFLSGELFQARFRALKANYVNQRALKHLRTHTEGNDRASGTAGASSVVTRFWRSLE